MAAPRTIASAAAPRKTVTPAPAGQAPVGKAPAGKGERLRLHVESLAFGGLGVARVDGLTVFVEGGLPGQEVEAVVHRRRRAYAEARVAQVLVPSPDQTTPRCDHFGTCGGCALQHLSYEAQIRAKAEQVAACLTRVGGLGEVQVLPTIPSPLPYAYRNKMEFSFAPRWLSHEELGAELSPGERFGLGLHLRRRWDRVVNVHCHLHSEEGARILSLVRDLAAAGGLPPYSTKTHEGFWRHLVIREGVRTGERMVVLLTNRVAPGSAGAREAERVGAALWAQGPPITSLLHGLTDRKSSVAACDELRVLNGEPVIRERLGDLEFEIGPNTFFQTNTLAAEGLFREALDRGAFRPEDTVWDLYCGVGAISLLVAGRVRCVVGIEVVADAVTAAERNARRNGIENASFVAGDVRQLVRDGALAGNGRPDVIVLDPPREGVHADVLAAVADAGPRSILYVSCNPATLARDLALFLPRGYVSGPVQPVDMFPHTAHIECVVRLDREVQNG